MKKSIFITGTGTGVGKTLVTGLLANSLQPKGKVITQKWVQTGCDLPQNSDLATHYKLMGQDFSSAQFDLQCPYLFPLAASPHLAATQPIDQKIIYNAMTQLQNQCDYLLIEGAGGIYVPLTQDLLMIDLVQEWSLPVIIVSLNQVGSINHTLLTIEALKKRKIQILGIVFNQVSPENRLVTEDTPKIINTFTGVPILATLSFCQNVEMLKNEFVDIIG